MLVNQSANQSKPGHATKQVATGTRRETKKNEFGLEWPDIHSTHMGTPNSTHTTAQHRIWRSETTRNIGIKRKHTQQSWMIGRRWKNCYKKTAGSNISQLAYLRGSLKMQGWAINSGAAYSSANRNL